jgi:hypothetical protein
MTTATKLMVVVAGDVSQAMAAIKQIDSQVATAARSMDANAKAASVGLGRINKAAQLVSGGLGGLAAGLGVAGLATLAAGAARAAVDLGNLGQQVEKQRKYFEAYSGGAAQATANLAAMDRAVGSAASESDKLTAANKFLAMELATNAGELERVAKMAVLLGGDTRRAGEAMQEFALMMANQSIERLDTFGISSGKVRQRIEELQAATQNMSREAAFMQAVLEIGGQKMAQLEAAGVKATTAADNLTAALERLRIQAAKKMAGPIGTIEANLTTILGNIAYEMESADYAAAFDRYRQAVEGVRHAQDNLETAKITGFNIDHAQAAYDAAKANEALAEGIYRAAQAAASGAPVIARLSVSYSEVVANAYAAGAAVSEAAALWKTLPLDPLAAFKNAPQTDLWFNEAPTADEQAEVLRRLKARQDEKTRLEEAAATKAANAYESKMKAAASRVAGYVSEAISFSKGLFDVSGLGGKGWNAPGANGPFENVYRALDIAKLGEASPWAKVLQMSQEEAKQLTGLFQQGLLTPEVIGKLVNVDALKQQAQITQQAEALQTAFADQVAAAAGVDPKVTKALLGLNNEKALAGLASDWATTTAGALGSQTKAFTKTGNDLILAVANGAEAARSVAVSKVEDIARAMVDAMIGVLGTGASTAAAVSAAAAGNQGQTAAATAINAAGARATGRGGTTVVVGGDSYNMLVSDAGTASLTAALIAERKRQRLNRLMS